MREPEYYAAIYAIIKDTDGKILFLRRANTGFQDGLFWLPAGHIEWEETYFEALKREVKEEVWIDIEEQNAFVKHISHRIWQGERTYFDIYFFVNSYTWIPYIAEPEKSSEVTFLDLKIEKMDIFQPYIYEVLNITSEEGTEENITVSEFIYKDWKELIRRTL